MRSPTGAASLRLVARRGRIVTARPLVLALGVLARAGALHAHALWPSATRPYLAIDPGYPPAADWFRRALERPPRRFPDAATWNVVRARALLLGRADGLAFAAAERALGPASGRRRVALYVHAGHPISKAVCFVFDPADSEPRAVVKAMPVRRYSQRLRDEVEHLAAIRALVSQEREVAAALPPAPLFAGNVDDDYVVVEDLDRLVGATGRAERAAALDWLAAFQAASSQATAPWSERDDADTLGVIDAAWLRARPDARAMVLDRTRSLLSELRGAPVPRCAVHGDFWRGNIARTGGQLRIFDWEWASLHGAPMFDLWTYELAELRVRAAAGDDDFAAPLRDALERVAAELSRRSLPTELAPATLPAVLARLAFRIHGATGFEDRMEKPSARVMASVEDVLCNTA
jgi:hypothetical protein